MVETCIPNAGGTDTGFNSWSGNYRSPAWGMAKTKNIKKKKGNIEYLTWPEEWLDLASSDWIGNDIPKTGNSSPDCQK